MNQELQRKVDLALSSLDGMQRAEASPYLYSKIRSRMQSATELVPRQLAWRMVAALTIVAVVNVFTILQFKPEESQPAGAESVANEYAISLPQTY